jgi:drug/metabolite transporter (DMT)-like permease
MKLDLAVAGVVLLSALLHACWNAVVKSDSDRLVSMGLVMVSGSLIGLAAIPFLPLPDPAAWKWLLISIAIHNFYYFFLLNAYAHGDLSHVYPIARGSGPLLVAIFSGALVGEHLSGFEFAGVLLVSVGIASLALAKGLPRGEEWRPTLYALATGVTIASYTLADGLGVRASGDALSYIAWLNVLEGPWVFLFALWLRGPAIVGHLRKYWWRGAGGGVVATVGYGLAIWALSVGGMAHVAALRETSVLWGSLIGTIVLGEAFGYRRVLAAVTVVSGLLLMHFAALF